MLLVDPMKVPIEKRDWILESRDLCVCVWEIRVFYAKNRVLPCQVASGKLTNK